MKKIIPLVLLGFGVALAVVIGQRMSTDAMADHDGVAVGVAASVPTSLLLIALLRREQRAARHEEPPAAPYGAYPQLPQPNMIVLDPSMFANMQNRPAVPLPPPDFTPDAGVRRLRVVGGDDDWN